jgi:hypothetical protein
MGEKLAWFFGITEPKFAYEIEEYHRMKEEEAKRTREDQTEKIAIGENGKISNIETISLETTNENRINHNRKL